METHTSSEAGPIAEGATIRELLANDHQRLEHEFQTIVTEATGGDLNRLRRTWTAFERELLAHLDAEENYLLHAFAAQRPLVASQILDEHKQIRKRLVEMGVDLDLHCLRADRVDSFGTDLARHARHEETIIYPWAALQLAPDVTDQVRRALRAAWNAGHRGAPLEQWRIDPARSTLGFSLRHLILMEIRGRFARWGGEIWFDRSDPARSTIKVWIDLYSVETGDAERDRHLRSSELLDVARFPQATFTSQAISAFDGDSASIQGLLELHGAEVKVDLDVSMTADLDGSDSDRLVFTARGALDRQRFGLHWNQDLDVGGLVVGDKVNLTAQVQAVRVT